MASLQEYSNSAEFKNHVEFAWAEADADKNGYLNTTELLLVLNEVFSELNTDNTDANTAARAVSSPRPAPPSRPLVQSDVDAILKDFDQDHKGRLTKDEFHKFCVSLISMIADDQSNAEFANSEEFKSTVTVAFKEADKDSSGYLDGTELLGVLGTVFKELELGIPPPTLEDVNNVLQDFDQDKNGKLSLDEFLKFTLSVITLIQDLNADQQPSITFPTASATDSTPAKSSAGAAS